MSSRLTKGILPWVLIGLGRKGKLSQKKTGEGSADGSEEQHDHRDGREP